MDAEFFGWSGVREMVAGQNVSRVERNFAIRQSPNILSNFSKIFSKINKTVKNY